MVNLWQWFFCGKSPLWRVCFIYDIACIREYRTILSRFLRENSRMEISILWDWWKNAQVAAHKLATQLNPLTATLPAAIARLNVPLPPSPSRMPPPAKRAQETLPWRVDVTIIRWIHGAIIGKTVVPTFALCIYRITTVLFPTAWRAGGTDQRTLCW